VVDLGSCRSSGDRTTTRRSFESEASGLVLSPWTHPRYDHVLVSRLFVPSQPHPTSCQLQEAEWAPWPDSQMVSWRNHVTSFTKSKAVRRYVNLLLRILTFLLVLSILLQFILAYIVAKDPRILPPVLRRAKNLLIVTAHPDDECLFFSPAILGVLDRNPDTRGGLIVLSSGLFLWSHLF
jgi:hypothetical protein